MQVDTMNESQMMILESFAGAQDEQELNALMDVLRNFYANRLESEMQRLWDDDAQSGEARSTARRAPPYTISQIEMMMERPKIILDTNCLLQFGMF